MMRWATILLLSLWSVIGFAADDASELFNPQQANKTLDQLSIKLSTEELNVQHLENAVSVLNGLQKKARECVYDSEKELAEVNKQLKVIGKVSQKTEEQTYLEKKKVDLEQLMSSCRLFDIRAGEVVEAFAETIKTQVTSELLAKDPPLWENITDSPTVIATLDKKFSVKTFVDNSGILALSIQSYIIASILFAIGIAVGVVARLVLRETLNGEASENLSTQIKYDLYSVLHRYLIYYAPTLFVGAYLYIFYIGNTQSAYILSLFVALNFYLLFMMSLRFFVCPPANKFAINKLPEKIGRTIVGRFRVFGVICIIAFMLTVILDDQSLPKQFYYLLETIFIVLVSVNVISIIWLVNQLPKLIYHYKGLRIVISAILSAMLVGIVTVEIFGYHNLAVHVLLGILLTILLFIVTWFINMVVISAINNLREGKLPWHQKLYYYLGMRQNEQLTELIWMQAVSYIMIWSSFLGLILQIWGLSESDERLMYTLFVEGFTIAHYTVVPAKIVFGLIFFTTVVLLTRLARGYFLRHTKIVKDTSARFALSTIVGYVGFVFAVIASLLIAGVDFTGIAIIAGALSVGVGFGLQNIVNNFVSGLILLIERPIKLGDRILVGSTEGYVRKISIRSTRIRTQDRTDVLVPNSELIASQVTNYMFMDKVYRIIVPVGVAYGSDTDLVRKILLQVALENEDVLSTERFASKVLFRSFGASSLDFELWAVIDNADKLNDVPSDINFSIDKAFRENNIEIAFPQQDIYIKELPSGIKSLDGD